MGTCEVDVSVALLDQCQLGSRAGQDTAKEISGPLWGRGGIPVIGADGVTYEVRNRVALCRRGASSNKPFCDGSHASIGFNDGK